MAEPFRIQVMHDSRVVSSSTGHRVINVSMPSIKSSLINNFPV
jgi:hypothetical protein